MFSPSSGPLAPLKIKPVPVPPKGVLLLKTLVYGLCVQAYADVVLLFDNQAVLQEVERTVRWVWRGQSWWGAGTSQARPWSQWYSARISVIQRCAMPPASPLSRPVLPFLSPSSPSIQIF